MDLSGARILVTGGTGFVGKYVVPTLASAGAQVFPIGKGMYDLRNESEAALAILAARPDIVVHLAAMTGGIANTPKNPASAFRDNVAMGMSVVHAATVQGAKVVFMSTAHIYPPDIQTPFREEDLWKGEPNPDVASYAGAKRAMLVMLEAYRKNHGLRFSYLIPTAMYGPANRIDEGAHVVAAMIKRFVEAKESGAESVSSWGTGRPKRTFLHAADAARAVALACGPAEGAINLPGTDEVSVAELANTVAELVGWKGEMTWDESKPDGMPRIALDGTKAKKLLRWEPEISLSDGLLQTVRWYLENQESKKAKA